MPYSLLKNLSSVDCFISQKKSTLDCTPASSSMSTSVSGDENASKPPFFQHREMVVAERSFQDSVIQRIAFSRVTFFTNWGAVASIMMHCRNTLFNFPRVTSLSTACKQTKLDANQSAVMDSLPPRVTSLSTACKQSKLDAKALVLE